ncbi:MAG: zf-HC2 domain-containing protein [Deltaproteobacteria bacterium]|nr:zf-HC2 domain-containing protein [Deltaproteobacteria bacterium]
MRCEETHELITALVDNELSHEERSSIEGHLKDCPRCRFVYGQEQTLKREVRMAGARVNAPADLKEKILSDRRIFPGRAESPKKWFELLWPGGSILRPALVVAFLMILALPTFYLMRSTEQPISLAAVETHDRIVKGDISFIRAGSQVEVIERLVLSVDGRFAPMGYDLSGMNLLPVGGMVQEVQGRKIQLVVYDGKGHSLTCYTFFGTEKDAPNHAAVFFDPRKKITFYSFSRGEINAVFHREGKLICILVSKMPMGDLLALARSKAQST